MTDPTILRDHLGRAIHERYRLAQQGIKSSNDPAMQPWQELPEDLRESNRQQADHMAATMRAIGCGLRPVVSGEPASFTFTPQEVEIMAETEHERWVAERRQAGWVYGPVRDVDRKITPYLVPYDELTNDVKELDRQAVRAIPDVLALAEFEVYRL